MRMTEENTRGDDSWVHASPGVRVLVKQLASSVRLIHVLAWLDMECASCCCDCVERGYVGGGGRRP